MPLPTAALQLRPASCARPPHGRGRPVQAAASAAPAAEPRVAAGVAEAKARLLQTVDGTRRGSDADALQRGVVEEAQVALEGLAGPELDYDQLEGLWLLRYTTAADVLPLVRAGEGAGGGGLLGPLPQPLRVGRVYQRFSGPAEGRVQNIIEASLALPLLDTTTARFVVQAGYEVRTARSIALTFRSAELSGVELGPGLEAALAPAVLPRGWWNLAALQAAAQLRLSAPLPAPRALPGRQLAAAAGGGFNYLLTYLDEEVLVGRGQGGGGVFIFTREPEPEGAAW